jgi:hypothetical protein
VQIDFRQVAFLLHELVNALQLESRSEVRVRQTRSTLASEREALSRQKQAASKWIELARAQPVH